MDPETTTPAAEAAPTEAPSYQDRVAQAMTDFSDFHAEAVREERAPEPPATPTPAPPQRPGQDDAHGPETEAAARSAATEEKPAAAATPAPTPEKPGEDAEARSNNERRAAAQQSQLARQLAEREAELERLRQQNQTLEFDNRVLYSASEQARRIAREQGGVRYEELDDATREAAVEQARIRQAQEGQRQQAAQATAAQTAAWEREVADRTSVGNAARKDAVAAVLEAAAQHGQKLTRDDAAKLLVETRADKLVEADIRLWQDERTPGDLARERIKLAMERNAELAVGKLTAQAVAQVEQERRQPGEYNRTMVPGESGEPIPARREANLPYEERKRRALAEFSTEVDAQIAQMARI